MIQGDTGGAVDDFELQIYLESGTNRIFWLNSLFFSLKYCSLESTYKGTRLATTHHEWFKCKSKSVSKSNIKLLIV